MTRHCSALGPTQGPRQREPRDPSRLSWALSALPSNPWQQLHPVVDQMPGCPLREGDGEGGGASETPNTDQPIATLAARLQRTRVVGMDQEGAERVTHSLQRPGRLWQDACQPLKVIPPGLCGHIRVAPCLTQGTRRPLLSGRVQLSPGQRWDLPPGPQ